MIEEGRCLSKVESKVMELVVLGKTNKDIAQELMISVSTVKTHLRQVMFKYGVYDRKQLIIMYYKK